MAKRVTPKKLQPTSAAVLMKRSREPKVSGLNYPYMRESFLDEMIDKKVDHADRVLRFYDRSAHRLN